MEKRQFVILVFLYIGLLARTCGYVAYVELELLSFRVLDRDTISEGTKCDDDHVNGAWNLCDFVFYVRNCSRIGTTYDCTTRINRFYAPENTDYVVFDYPRPATGVTIEGVPKEMVFNITVFDQDDGRSADDFVGNYLLRVTPDLIFRQDSRLVGMTEQLITIPRHSELKLRWRAYCGDTECRNYQGGFSQSSGLELGIGDNRWTGSALVNQINYRGEQPVQPQWNQQLGQIPPTVVNPIGAGFVPNQGPLIPVPVISIPPVERQIQIPPIQGPQFPVNNFPNQQRALFPRETNVSPDTPEAEKKNPEMSEQEKKNLETHDIEKKKNFESEDRFIPIHWRNITNTPVIGPHPPARVVMEQVTPSKEILTTHATKESSKEKRSESTKVAQETKWSDLKPERIDATYKKDTEQP